MNVRFSKRFDFDRVKTIESVKCRHTVLILKECQNNISLAAYTLGIARLSLYRCLKRWEEMGFIVVDNG